MHTLFTVQYANAIVVKFLTQTCGNDKTVESRCQNTPPALELIGLNVSLQKHKDFQLYSLAIRITATVNTDTAVGLTDIVSFSLGHTISVFIPMFKGMLLKKCFVL